MPYAHRNFFVKFNKVDEEHRIVWGIAQSENIDLQNDLLTYPASVEAFTKWGGNIREMHTDNAIGKAIQIIPMPRQKAIMVGAYISKGAEAAWQKVLDGTYTGYSIGGDPLVAEKIIKDGKRVRKITKYTLDELSLVDTPANPKCVVRAITKRADSTLVATDVLGHLPVTRTASDVLSLHEEVQQMSIALNKSTRVKIKELVGFTKSLKDGEDVMVVKQGDFTRNADGTFTLKKNAEVIPLKKSELEGDGYTDESPQGDSQPTPDDIDFEQHAGEAAGMHKSFCKMAGIDDNEGHYHNATADQDGDGVNDGPDVDADEADAGIDKSRNGRRRSNMRKGASMTKSDVTKQIAEAVGGLETRLLGEIKTLLGSAPAARNDGAGAPIIKRAGDVIEGSTVDTENPNFTRLVKAYKTRAELLDAQVTDANRKQRESVSKDLAFLEMSTTPEQQAEALAASLR